MSGAVYLAIDNKNRSSGGIGADSSASDGAAVASQSKKTKEQPTGQALADSLLQKMKDLALQVLLADGLEQRLRLQGKYDGMRSQMNHAAGMGFSSGQAAVDLSA